MYPLIRKSLVVCCLACAALTTTALAEPIEFSEVSLLVRARESEPSIIQEVTRRKLVRPLTPQQENTLRTNGAGESLIKALRGSALVLSQADATAFEARRTGERKAVAQATAANRDEAQDDIHVFEISAGHPVNLSQWGGPDYEFAFHGSTQLDEGREDAVMVDNTRSFTHTATYLGAGRAEDSRTIFDRRNYVAVADHVFTRGLRIDRRNPVWMKGVPYTLYPVYAAGGVSLYYITGSSSSVTLAVTTAR
jgi:hypothetical protein